MVTLRNRRCLVGLGFADGAWCCCKGTKDTPFTIKTCLALCSRELVLSACLDGIDRLFVRVARFSAQDALQYPLQQRVTREIRAIAAQR